MYEDASDEEEEKEGKVEQKEDDSDFGGKKQDWQEKRTNEHSEAPPTRATKSENAPKVRPSFKNIRINSRRRAQSKLYDADDAILVSSHQLLRDIDHKIAFWCILPTHSWKYKWDILIVFLALYSCLVSPLEIGFSFAWDGMALVEGFVTCAFLFDLVFNFCTAYEDSSGKLETSASKIRSRYLARWFIVDFFASFPFAWFGGGS